MSALADELKFVKEAVEASDLENIALGKDIEITENMVDFGEGYAQGDVLLIRMRELPSDARKLRNPSPKIAEGNTQGANHIWDSMEGVTVYESQSMAAANPLFGAIYKLDKKRTLTHPGHGHHTYFGGSLWYSTFQRANTMDLQRLRD